jgi:hypothetical protein
LRRKIFSEAVSSVLRASSRLKHEDDLSDAVAQIIFMLQPEKPPQAA